MTQLETLQELFKNRAFIIPDYQRGYAWKSDHRTDLLNDLEDLAQIQQGKVHYTGTIVLHRGVHKPRMITGTTYELVDIVDGQQRVTTLVTLLNCIVEAMASLDEEDMLETSNSLRNEYIERRSKQTSLSRLSLNGTSDLFFRDYVIGDGKTPDPTEPAHQNLLNAKREFTTYISNKISLLKSNADKFESLNHFVSQITNRLGFVIYEVNDEAEVGVMFEVMNARGRSLTEMEKVKNYLLYIGSRVSENSHDLTLLTKDVNETWAKVIEAVTNSGTNGSEDQFLRNHWGIYPGAGWYDKSRSDTSDIHGAVKKTLNLRTGKTKETIYKDIRLYLLSLRTMAISYRDVINPAFPSSFSYINGAKADVVERGTSIQRIGRAATVLPILMASHNKFGDDVAALSTLFRMLETLAFRLVAVGKRADAGDTYAFNIAAAIVDGTLTAHQAEEKIRDLTLRYCTNNLLKATLIDESTNFFEWTPLVYFLFEYERWLVEQAGQKFTLDWQSFYRKRNDSIEHILPQGNNTLLVQYWKDHFTHDSFIACKNRLGNLCLTDWNSSYSNHSFPEKLGSIGVAPDKKVYRNSRWRMERDLAKFADWTPDSIAKRQEDLAVFALKRWAL